MASCSTPHVLAVDDSHLDRVLVANLLRKSSCRVTIVENAMEALNYLEDGAQASKVNLILSDYCMPGMTGYELLKKVKESTRMKGIPVVIMSSESVPTIINQCLEEGAQMFIKKPLKLSDVQMLRCQVMNC
ncbi:hypothetical protein V2J09_012117 [Rumex salicifolius]